MGDLSEHEELIEQYLGEGNTEAAVQLLSELIVKSAREKNFQQAEALRGRLFEVDSMALREIVKTGEIIETEKSKAIDKGHLETWSELYASLVAAETNALFYGMQPEEVPANHMLVKQGDICSRLYFIDEGRLKMFYRQDDKAILLKTLGPGDLVGEDVESQARQALENVKQILIAAGSSLEQTTAVDVFLTDMGDFLAFNAIYAEYFSAHKPARAAIEVGALPKGGCVEIKCIALVG